jgi:hypothetical protein
MKPEYLELDSLAMTLGLELGSADQALKAVLSKVIGEQDKYVSKRLLLTPSGHLSPLDRVR